MNFLKFLLLILRQLMFEKPYRILNSSKIFLALTKLQICSQTKVLNITVKCLEGY